MSRMFGASLEGPILVTGHTGFKGAWLVIMLKELGHKVSGVSLDPLPGSLFELGNVEKLLEHDVRVDIRNLKELEDAFHEAVDKYLAACEKLGQKPNKPYSGNLMLRVPAEVHAARWSRQRHS